MSKRCLLAALLLVTGGTAHAKLFRNAYVSFDLPPNWNCKLEASEWVCENDFAQKTKEAVIILTAKEVGPSDTLPGYLAHLQVPRAIPGKGGTVKSQIMNVKERMITNHMWIDGLHLGSEVGPYFTRYLATIKDRIAILVTFSAHKQHYTKFSGDFIKAIESLRVVATKDTLAGRQGSTAGAAGGAIDSGGLGGPLPGGDLSLPNELAPGARGAGGGAGEKVLGFAVLCLAIGGYLFLRGRKGKKKSKPKPGPRKGRTK